MKWTTSDNNNVFSSYHYLLDCQNDGVPVVKNQEVKRIEALLNRTHKAIESKFGNISQIRKEMGLEVLKGYPPLKNYAKSTQADYQNYLVVVA